MLHKSINQALADLETIQQKIVKELSQKEVDIFEYHKLLLQDEDLLNAVEIMVRKEKINVAFVWLKQIKKKDWNILRIY